MGQQHQRAQLQQCRREPQPEVEERIGQAEGVGDREGRHDPHRERRRQSERDGDGGCRETPPRHPAAQGGRSGVGDLAVTGAVIPARHDADERGHHEDDHEVEEVDQHRLDEIGTGTEGAVGVQDDVDEGAAHAHRGQDEQCKRHSPPAERQGEVPDRLVPGGAQP